MNGHILARSSIAVDFWTTRGSEKRYIHFLSHVHGDHIVGLTSTWMQPIYCSEVTAEILHLHYGLSKSLLHCLPVNQAIIISLPHSEKTFCVTAFDANHCPGALMFYFQGDFGNIFYTGDFRYSSDAMSTHLKTLCGKIDVLYLDNTFCSPKCQFPSREECFTQIMDIIKEHPNHSIVIGIRKLGKEAMLVELGISLDETIYVSPERLNVIQLLYSTNIFAPLSDVKSGNGRIKTIPFHQVSSSLLFKLNETTPTIAILPSAIFTGLPAKPFSRNPHIYVIPYSDHSSYPELIEFVSQMKPSQIIPIVNNKRGPFGADISDRQDMSCFKPFLSSFSLRGNHSNGEKYDDQTSTVGVTKGGTLTASYTKGDDDIDVSASLRNFNEPVIYKSICDDNDSIQQDCCSYSQLKRKRSSSPPYKKRRKPARGICYIDDPSDDENQINNKKTFLNEGSTDENIHRASCGLESKYECSKNESVVLGEEDNKELSVCSDSSGECVSSKNQTFTSTLSSFGTEAECTNTSFTGSEQANNFTSFEATTVELKSKASTSSESSYHLSASRDESYERLCAGSLRCDAQVSESAIKPSQSRNHYSYPKVLHKEICLNQKRVKSNKCIISTLKSLIEKWGNSSV